MSVVDAVDVVVIATSISDGMFLVMVVFVIAERVIWVRNTWVRWTYNNDFCKFAIILQHSMITSN